MSCQLSVMTLLGWVNGNWYDNLTFHENDPPISLFLGIKDKCVS